MTGLLIVESGFLIPALIALFAGALSFLSPCVLPIVPPYLAYIGGVSLNEIADSNLARRRAIGLAVFFVMGLSTIFLLLGASASSLGGFFIKNQLLFMKISGVVIGLLGLHFIGLFRFAFMNRELRFNIRRRKASGFGAYILGLAFAFGWTPCIGPQLGAILALAAQDGTFVRGGMLLGFYAIGLGVPFILAAVFFTRAQRFVAWLRPHMRLIEILMGSFLLLIGAIMFGGAFTVMNIWLLDTFPFFQYIG